MPKMYSEKERTYIVKRLKEEAKELLTIYSVKKITVDELVKRVNIPKGTFYLFYSSKELLLYDVINEIENEIQAYLLREILVIKEKATIEVLTDCLLRIYKMVDDTCLLRVMINGDLDLIMRRLPDEILKEHMRQDDFSMERIISLIPQAKGKKIEHYSGALRGIFMTMLHKREIGKEIFDDAFRLMIRGIAIQLMEVE